MAIPAASNPPQRERGVVMLGVLALVILLTSGVVLVGMRTAAQNQGSSDQTTTRALAAARAALIGWAVAEPDFPGGLPLPDRNGETTPDYNGFSDCTSVTSLPAGSPTPNIAIGRLPWRGLEANCLSNTTLGGLSSNLRDGAGEGLWYAVSANLLRVGNGTAVVQPRVDWSEPTVAPVFNWLTVLDANGTVLSNRVAFVVIAPGAPVWRGDLPGAEKTQDRSAAAPNADRFLDRFTVGVTTYDNADADGVFIMASDNTRGPEGAPSGTDGFNDRLLYVTIDELMPLVAERVLDEMGDILLAYQATYGRMPWAAPFGDPASQASYKSSADATPPTQRFGLLPILFPGEVFATPMVIRWRNLTNVNVTPSGTVTAAHLSAPDPAPTPPIEYTTLTPPGVGNCTWEFEFRMTCTHAGVQSVTVANGVTTPWGVPCPTAECERQTSLIGTVRLEEGPAVLTAPTATETRTRRVRSTLPRTPFQSFGVQMVDYTCTGPCPTGATEVGRGTLSLGPFTTGEVLVEGVRHELTVVDRFNPLLVNPSTYRADLPHWFFTAGWHKRMLMGVANGLQPGGGGACTPGTDCITVDTVDANGAVIATDNTVPTMLVYGGWPIAANGGFASNLPAAWFEFDNADTDERFSRPASVGVRNTLDAAGTFNDQFRVIAP